MPRPGFSLIEMLLSVALIGILAGLSLPVYQSYQVRNDVQVGSISLMHSLRRAQTQARANFGDDTWGVHLASGSITLFQGASYATRDSSYDETYDLPTSIAISGTTDYLFAKLTGLPTATGSTTLSSVAGGSRTITVNGKGTVEQ